MKRTVATTVAAVVAAVALSGCSSHKDKTPSDVVVVQPRPTTSSGVISSRPDPSDTDAVPDAALKAATAYLTVRENINSARYRTPQAVIAAFRPVMTAGGYKDVTSHFDPKGNLAGQWTAGHENGYAVRVTADCATLPDASGGTYLALQCKLIDTTIGKDGEEPIDGSVPVQWVYQGTQPTATLALVQHGDAWLVDADATGQAN